MADSVFNLIVRVQANVGQAISSLNNLENAANRAFRNLGGSSGGGIGGGVGGSPIRRPFGVGGFARDGGSTGMGPLPFMPGAGPERTVDLAVTPGLERAAIFKDEFVKMQKAGYQEVATGIKSTGQAAEVAKPKVEELDKSVNNVNSSIMNTGRAFAVMAAGRTIQRIGEAFFAPFKSVFMEGMKITATMEDIRARYTTLFKDKNGLADLEKVNDMMLKTRVFAVETPFLIQDVAAAVVQFKGFGMDAFAKLKDASGALNNNLILMAGNLAATFSGMTLAEAVTMLGQISVGAPGATRRMLTRGIQPMDIRQFGIDHGFKIAGELIDKNGKMIGTKIRQHQKEWMDIISEFFDAKSGGMMEARSKTLGGFISNIKDMWGQILTVGMGGIPEDMAKKLNIDQLTEINKESVFGRSKSGLNEVFNALKHTIGFDLFDKTGQLPDDKLKEFQDRLLRIKNLFDALFRPVTIVLTQIIHLIDWLVKMNDAHPKLVKFAATFLAIAAGLTIVIGSLLVFAGLIMMLGPAAAAIGAFLGVTLTGPALAGWAIAAISALAGVGAAAVIWGDKIGAAADKVHDKMEAAKKALERDNGVIGKTFTTGEMLLEADKNPESIWENTKREILGIGGAIASVAEKFKSLGPGISKWFSDAVNSVPGVRQLGELLANKLGGGLTDGFSNLFKGLGAKIRGWIRELIFNTFPFLNTILSVYKLLSRGEDTTISNIQAEMERQKKGIDKPPTWWEQYGRHGGDQMADAQEKKDKEKAKEDKKYPFTAESDKKEASAAKETAAQNKDKAAKETALETQLKAQNAELKKHLSEVRNQMIENSRRRGVIELHMNGKMVGQGIERERIDDNNRTHGAPVRPQLGYGRL